MKLSKIVSLYDVTLSVNGSKNWSYALSMRLDQKNFHRKWDEGHVSNSNAHKRTLMSILYALNQIKTPVRLTVKTSDDRILNAMTLGYLKEWAKKDWKASNGKSLPYADLWKQIAEELERVTAAGTKVTWLKREWCRTHY